MATQYDRRQRHGIPLWQHVGQVCNLVATGHDNEADSRAAMSHGGHLAASRITPSGQESAGSTVP